MCLLRKRSEPQRHNAPRRPQLDTLVSMRLKIGHSDARVTGSEIVTETGSHRPTRQTRAPSPQCTRRPPTAAA
eukprot:2814748-Rhodomonas_salina.2